MGIKKEDDKEDRDAEDNTHFKDSQKFADHMKVDQVRFYGNVQRSMVIYRGLAGAVSDLFHHKFKILKVLKRLPFSILL